MAKRSVFTENVLKTIMTREGPHPVLAGPHPVSLTSI